MVVDTQKLKGKIIEKGTKILVQYVPNDKPEPLEKFIK